MRTRLDALRPYPGKSIALHTGAKTWATLNCSNLFNLVT